MSIYCPKCKLVVEDGDSTCYHCGAGLLNVPLAGNMPKSSPLPGEGGVRQFEHEGTPFSVEVDTMLPLQTDMGNSLRLLFSPLPGAGKLSNVKMSISPINGNFPIKEKKRQSIAEPYEFVFGGSGLKQGVWVCEVSVSYILDNRYHSCDGTIQLFVHGREKLLKEAEDCIAFLVSNRDVRKLSEESSYFRTEVPEIARRLLVDAVDVVKRNPLDRIVELVSCGVRKYQKVDMSRSDGIDVLQKPPPEAVRTEIQLDFGYEFGAIQFFTDPIISIGHTFDGTRYTDVIVDPPIDVDETRKQPYLKMSRGHCLLQSNGRSVEIADGRIRASGKLVESTNGTYVDGQKIEGFRWHELRGGAIGLGTKNKETTLDVQIATPKIEACQSCRLGGEGREYCCPGGHVRANAVLRRMDGVPVVYVALWSCIDIGVIYSAFSGLEIFYANKAFAWRHGTRRGWLVPGGSIELSHCRPITVSNVWDEADQPDSNSSTKKGDDER